MNIVRDYEFEEHIIKQIAEREFGGERTGIHQSDLNYCLNKQALRKFTNYQNSQNEILLYSVGWSTQRWLTGKDEDEEPLIVDGITVTRDASYEDLPWELKASYESSKNPIDKQAARMRQVMAQCYVTGVTSARITRFEIMGDWGRISPRPTLSAWRVSFTKEELVRNWNWFKERKILYERILTTKELLPRALALPPGGAYECERCPFEGKECKGESQK